MVDPSPFWDEDFTSGNWKVFTANSVFLLDCDNKRVKRVHIGQNALPADDEWVEYEILGPCSVGKPMEFVWSLDGTLKLRVTSAVEAIHRLEG